VLRLLANGYAMKEIATALDISSRTVAFHKYQMMEQLGIKSSAELIQYAVRRKII
jgi:DNA-binding NarL/FixJ family response regulator